MNVNWNKVEELLIAGKYSQAFVILEQALKLHNSDDEIKRIEECIKTIKSKSTNINTLSKVPTATWFRLWGGMALDIIKSIEKDLKK